MQDQQDGPAWASPSAWTTAPVGQPGDTAPAAPPPPPPRRRRTWPLVAAIIAAAALVATLGTIAVTRGQHRTPDAADAAASPAGGSGSGYTVDSTDDEISWFLEDLDWVHEEFFDGVAREEFDATMTTTGEEICLALDRAFYGEPGDLDGLLASAVGRSRDEAIVLVSTVESASSYLCSRYRKTATDWLELQMYPVFQPGVEADGTVWYPLPLGEFETTYENPDTGRTVLGPTGVRWRPDVLGDVEPAAGMVFLAVDLYVSHEGTGSTALDTVEVSLREGDAVYDTVAASTDAAFDEDAELVDGETVFGTIVIEVPQDWEGRGILGVGAQHAEPTWFLAGS